MATIYARFSNPDLGVVGNYNTAADGSGSSGLPTDGDDVVVVGSFPHVRLTTGFADLAGIELGSFTVEEGAVLNTDSHIQLDLDNSGGTNTIEIRGVGDMKFEAVDSASAGNGGILKAVIYPSRAGGRVHLKGDGGAGWGTISAGGVANVLIEETALPTAVYVNDSARVEIDSAATAIVTAVASNNAYVKCSRNVTTAEINNNAILWEDNADIATCNIRGTASGLRPAAGGRLMLSGGSIAGTTALNIYAGSVMPGKSAAGGGVSEIRNVATFGSRSTILIASRVGGDQITVTGAIATTAGETISAASYDFGTVGSAPAFDFGG